MLSIGVDARLIHYRRGMGTVVHSLLGEWIELMTTESAQFKLTLYVDSIEATKVAAQFAACQPNKVVVKPITPKFYPLWEQWLLPRQALRDKIDVLYCPANTAPIMLSRRIKLALTIHDVMYLLPRSQLPESPSWYQRLGRLYRRWNVPHATQRADLICTDSIHSQGDIVHYLGQNAARVNVVPLAAAADYTPQPAKNIIRVLIQFGIRQPYVLALGAIDPRKNTARVIEAFAEFLQCTKSTANSEGLGVRRLANTQLVITGLNAVAQTHFAKHAQLHGLTLGKDLILLGFVPENELAALYTGAKMLLYPSLYEGFGLPVLEAMACGTPVVASNTSAIPEIAGEAAILIDPTDTAIIAQAIWRVMTDLVLREKLTNNGLEQAARFSWHISAKIMLTLLSKVAAQ